MSRFRVLSLCAAVMITVTGALPGVAVAQETSPVDAAVLQDLCAVNAPSDGALEECLSVVHRYLVPGSGPSIGTRFEVDELGVTLKDVRWDATVDGLSPETGETFIAILVAYDALGDADYSATDDWNTEDENGTPLQRVTPGVLPELDAGQLESGETVEGWLTFRAPAGIKLLEVAYSDGLFGSTSEFLVVPGTTSGDAPAATTAPAATPKPTAKPTPAPTPKPVAYAKLSDRGWKKLVKNPDAYVGRRYTVYACIAQFDAATGPDMFRGQASYRQTDWWYTDGSNSLFMGTAAQLDNFVQGDIVWMQVVSAGSYSYETQVGGNTTVPLFEVDRIKRQSGSC